MTTPAIAVVTMTLARTKDEERLLERSLAQLAERPWPIFITDGGSAATFVARLETIPGITVQRAHGLVAQVSTSMRAALAQDAQLLLYTEPDKLTFFAEQVEDFARLSQDGTNRLSIAMRSVASFATYPGHQRITETIINRRCSEQFGVTGDFSYGPFTMPAALANHLREMPAHLGWGWRHFTFAVAHRLGYEIALIEGDYPCPLDQRDEHDAERVHRDRQLRENVEGLTLGMTVPLARRASSP